MKQALIETATTAVTSRGHSIAMILAAMFCATAAEAEIPMFNATCPQGIEVHADKGGPVFINGQQTALKAVNQNYYEASGSNVTISLSINPDGSPSVSYTAAGRAHGNCTVASASTSESADGTSKGGTPPMDIRGSGKVTSGGLATGHIISKNGRVYALILTATKDGLMYRRVR